VDGLGQVRRGRCQDDEIGRDLSDSGLVMGGFIECDRTSSWLNRKEVIAGDLVAWEYYDP
jgi:hypothetical protein